MVSSAIGAEEPPLPGARARDGASVAEQCSALLFAQALKPLVTALGFYGEIVVSQAALAVARALAPSRR